MLIKQLSQVPDDLFNNALSEINNIQWDKLTDPSRKNNAVFQTSTAVHIRRHKVPEGQAPKTVKDWSMLLDCVDDPLNSVRFPNVRKLADWMYNTAGGVELGRIMIVRLEAGGVVDLHIDPFDYFEKFSRFHVPIRTNENVVFNGGKGTADEHMPYKTLCQLNNRLPHQLENRSDDFRIHVIADIRLEGGNQIF